MAEVFSKSRRRCLYTILKHANCCTLIFFLTFCKIADFYEWRNKTHLAINLSLFSDEQMLWLPHTEVRKRADAAVRANVCVCAKVSNSLSVTTRGHCCSASEAYTSAGITVSFMSVSNKTAGTFDNHLQLYSKKKKKKKKIKTAIQKTHVFFVLVLPPLYRSHLTIDILIFNTH